MKLFRAPPSPRSQILQISLRGIVFSPSNEGSPQKKYPYIFCEYLQYSEEGYRGGATVKAALIGDGVRLLEQRGGYCRGRCRGVATERPSRGRRSPILHSGPLGRWRSLVLQWRQTVSLALGVVELANCES